MSEAGWPSIPSLQAGSGLESGHQPPPKARPGGGQGKEPREEVPRGGAYAGTCHPTHLLSAVVTPASPGPAPAGPGMLARAPERSDKDRQTQEPKAALRTRLYQIPLQVVLGQRTPPGASSAAAG